MSAAQSTGAIRAPARIGFIGLGTMGRPMGANLIRAGFELAAYDIAEAARAAFAAETGTQPVASVAEACAGVDAIVTMLPDGKFVRRALLEGPDGPAVAGAAPGTVLIEMSSSSPVDSRALGEPLAAHGVRMVDAPVSGTAAGAIAATLTIMCGGEADDVARVTPVLEGMGRRIVHAGPLGAGHAMKALNNYIVATEFLAGAEVLLIGRRFGLDPSLMLDIINSSTGRNLCTEGPLKNDVVPGTFAAGFWLRLMAKDVGNAAELADHVGMPARLARFGADLWADASRRLGEDADFTEVYKVMDPDSDPGPAGEGR